MNYELIMTIYPDFPLRNPPFFSGAREKKNTRQMLTYLTELWGRLGPFDGIMGYSQGAAVAGAISEPGRFFLQKSLLKSSEKEIKTYYILFIFICGNRLYIYIYILYTYTYIYIIYIYIYIYIHKYHKIS